MSHYDSSTSNYYSKPYGSNSYGSHNDSHYHKSPKSDSYQPEDRDEKPNANYQYSGTIDFDKYEDIPVETSGRDCPSPINTWRDIELGSAIINNIEQIGYKKPTPVQRYSLPIVLQGRDLMGCAQTGSGKTAAFLLPIIAQILKRGPHSIPRGDNRAYPRALIIAPTRELAVQIHEEARKFSNRSGVRAVVVYGGASINYQLRDLTRAPPDILVATPGRLVDIIERGNLSLSDVRFLVLDEADRMLDMGFEPQIRRIVEREHMPPRGERQTLMFSATFPREIQALAASFLNDYVFLTVGRVGSATELVTQKFVHTPTEQDKEEALMPILQQTTGLTLIFVETKKKASNLDYLLRRRGFRSSSIHGDRSQAERTAALKSFSVGATPILIATNVAARGLDISNVTHVINYEMPNNIDDYVHRVGRTGRAGKSGISTAFISEKDSGMINELLKILRGSGQTIPTWLEAMQKPVYGKRSFGGGHHNNHHHHNNGGGGHRFGGRDFRQEHNNNHNQHHNAAPRFPFNNNNNKNTGGGYQQRYNPAAAVAANTNGYGGSYGAAAPATNNNNMMHSIVNGSSTGNGYGSVSTAPSSSSWVPLNPLPSNNNTTTTNATTYGAAIPPSSSYPSVQQPPLPPTSAASNGSAAAAPVVATPYLFPQPPAGFYNNNNTVTNPNASTPLAPIVPPTNGGMANGSSSYDRGHKRSYSPRRDYHNDDHKKYRRDDRDRRDDRYRDSRDRREDGGSRDDRDDKRRDGHHSHHHHSSHGSGHHHHHSSSSSSRSHHHRSDSRDRREHGSESRDSFDRDRR